MSDTAQARELLDAALEDLAAATGELRELAHGIHPAALTEGGLRPALEALVARSHRTDPARGRAARAVRCSWSRPRPTSASPRASPTRRATRGAQHVEVEAAEVGDRLRVEVRDDGRGGADAAAGSGLRGLADRLAALDGGLEVISPPGGGTVLRAEIPCGS